MQLDHNVSPDQKYVLDVAKERDTARRLLKDLLWSRFNGLSAWATTNACVFLEHPPRSDKSNACACGKVKS